MLLPPPKLLLISFVVAFGSNFQFGYQLSVVNTAEAIFLTTLNSSWIQRFDRPISSAEFAWFWSLSVNIFFVGGLVGVPFVSATAERFGRRNAILLSNVPSVIGTVLMCIWPATSAFELLVIGRFLAGFNAGLSSGLQPLYLTEISLREYRGIISAFQVRHQICN